MIVITLKWVPQDIMRVQGFAKCKCRALKQHREVCNKWFFYLHLQTDNQLANPCMAAKSLDAAYWSRD